MRAGVVNVLNLLFVSWIVFNNFDSVDCDDRRRKPRKYHALRHAGGAAGKKVNE